MGLGSNYEKAKPFLAVVFMQFGYAGMSIIAKSALNQGMSPHVLVVYRHAIATLVIAPFALVFDRSDPTSSTYNIYIHIFLLITFELYLIIIQESQAKDDYFRIH